MQNSEKMALVTGGAVRLGRAISLALVQKGYTVAVHYHGSTEAAHSLESEIRELGGTCLLLRADLGDPQAVEGLFGKLDQQFGGLDALVNNAAIFERVEFEQISMEALQRMWSLNAVAPFLCSQLAVPRMRRRGGGSIVNITDIAAERPFPVHAHYCMSKSALLSLTKSLAIELAPAIRVNAVAPGSILFPDNYPEEKRAAVIRRVPAGRTGSAEELADAVAYLLDGPDFITGQVLAVDGGRSARL